MQYISEWLSVVVNNNLASPPHTIYNNTETIVNNKRTLADVTIIFLFVVCDFF